MTLRLPTQHLLFASDIEFVSDGDVTFELKASDTQGRLLIFRNAILARAEVNKNLDEIPADEIDNLAATIAGCPIDLEHRADVNIGVFTAGRGIDTPLGRALSVDGLIWADRYEAEARGVKNGSHLLSVEASASQVSCSKCGKVYAAKGDYCEHLRARRRHDARRVATGLKSVGGAVTQKPAGTATAFDRSQLFLVASHAEDDLVEAQEKTTMNCPRCGKETTSDEKCTTCGKGITAMAIAADLNEAMGKLTTAETQLQAAQAETTTITASLDAEKTAKTVLEQAAADAEAKRKEAADQLVEVRASLRRLQIGASMTDEVWTAKKPVIMAMADDQFDLLLGFRPAAPAASPAATGVLMPGRKAGQTPVELG